MEFGHLCLVAAFLLSAFGAVVGTIGAKKRNPQFIQSALNALPIVALLGVLSVAALTFGFLTHDYRYAYVWRTSNNAMPGVYLISAVWGGMDGSLLLWAALLSGYSAACVLSIFGLGAFAPRLEPSGVQHSKIFSWVIPILHGSALFFYAVVLFLTNPFRFIESSVLPMDGNGLNPLLQNPSMMIHPPSLYLGFTGFVIPFAFAFASLICREGAGRWTSFIRRWTCIAWGFLTIGIILGGNWAYIELGWGGFWAWDPVENASFLPWLTATAYLHSIMVEERRGMLRIWNLILPILTYVLVVFGTFLTRSGIVQSVHAFASSDVGEVFLVYIALIVGGSVILLLRARGSFRPENRFEGMFSREMLFLLNNLLFLGICFATFWGVMFPVFSELVTGTQSVVGPPFFNAVNVPLFLLLLGLMAIAPMVAWRGMAFTSFLRVAMVPLAIGFVATLIALYLASHEPLAALAYGFCATILAGVFAEFHRGSRARKSLGVSQGYLTLFRSRPRKYGGLLVHVGIAVMVVSITSSMVFKIEQDVILERGVPATVGQYELHLRELTESQNPNYSALHAEVEVYESGELVGTLSPERRFYPRSQETTTEVDIRMTPRDDLYLALAGLDTGTVENAPTDLATAKVVLKVFVNPLQFWLWIGSLIVLVGTGIVVVGTRVSREAMAADFGLAPEAIR